MTDEKQTEKSIAVRVAEIIESELGIDPAEITPNADLEVDLGADSLDVVELVMRCEEEFDIEVSDEDADKIKTVADAVKLVERLEARKL